MTPKHYHGPIPPIIWELLNAAHHNGGITVQSNLARECAIEVALCASQGWLSTISPDGQTCGRVWRITLAGLTALTNKELFK